jgi:leucyl-tRNA synthetase
MEYNFTENETKWQKYWAENKTFKAELNLDKPKYYVLDMFPYPSGSGLHVGHPLGYIASDIYSRYMRLKGFNVLHPMGYDAFGLPAEQYAIQTGQHPAKTTEENILRYRSQLDKIGFSFDWDRAVKTADANYYKWTQWIFMQLFNSYYCNVAKSAKPIEDLIEIFAKEGNQNIDAANSQNENFSAADWNSFDEKTQSDILLNYRLAFLSEAVVNWCPELGTVLANDEVKDGKSERGGYAVIQKKMTQWSLRITAYAQRLLDGIENLDWSDSLKDIQTNWIGRSEGALVQFKTESGETIEVFTTRPDTIFGVSFMVLAPEHELVSKLTTPAQKEEVSKYIEYASHRSERDRMSETKKVTGAFTGAFAINPFSGDKVPVYIADYVLAGYGTGAVMAVPSGDQRDWDFANHFNLPIPPVIEGQDVSAGAEDSKEGILCNSDFLNGLPVKKAIKRAIHEIESKGIGEKQINFKMRDAVFGRQRYWGEPIPVYYENGIPKLIKKEHLPLALPEIDKYLPTEDGEPPLKRADKWNYHPEKGLVPNGEGFPVELTTMPGWAGSSWYFLRYMDANNSNEFASKEALEYWGPVDFYMGGAEHATGHLLYFRFWTKVLKDLGFVSFEEPAKKLINQGMIQAEDGQKMSKRYGNVVNPDDVIAEHGADALRLHEMFLGPIEMHKPWNTKGIEGVSKFLRKLWRLFHDANGNFAVSEETPTKEEQKSLHKAIKKFREDTERFAFNTSVSTFMVAVNELTDLKCNKREILESLTILASCHAPHITEELWQKLGKTTSISFAKLPEVNEDYLKEDSKKYPISFNGKMRFTLDLPMDMTKDEIEKAVMENEQSQKYLEGKTPKKVIVVPGKIVNVVV